MSDEVELLGQVNDGLSELIGVMHGIEGILDGMASTLEMIESNQAVLVWQGMPWWRRLAHSWRDARSTLDQTEAEQGTEGIIFRTTDGT